MTDHAWRGRGAKFAAVDQEYFANYCGYGPYAENYLFHSGIEHCISIFRRLRLEISSVVVLGTASGEVLSHFERTWGVRPVGCEISEWAHAQIPAAQRRRIERADMRDYLKKLVARQRRFDLMFANSLIYLQENEIPGFLADCARVCRHFHFWSSTSEDYEKGDRYRVTLRPAAWWKQAFTQAGFAATRSPYVFRSQVCAKPRRGADVSRAAASTAKVK